MVLVGLAEPEQLEVPAAFHPRLIHIHPECHRAGRWVKTCRLGKTRPRPHNLGCSGNCGNRQAGEVVPCSADRL
jgi:hypothetical protein